MTASPKPVYKRVFSRWVRDPLRRIRRGALSVQARMRARLMPKAASAAHFFRGKLVSILLPSRGRPAALKETVANLVGCAEEPGRIEILIRLDEDDAASRAVVAGLIAESQAEVKVVVGGRGRGYAGMHVFVNELCEQARGDFLFLFNDDARMETPGWESALAAYRDRLCVLKARGNYPPDTNPFPIVHRKLRDMIGHFSMGPYCDKWMVVISRAAGIEREVDLSVFHQYHAESGENLANLNADQTAAEIDRAESHRRQYAWLTRLQLDMDAARVKAHIARFGDKLDWRQE